MKAARHRFGLVLATVMYLGGACPAGADPIVDEGFDVPSKYTADAALKGTSPTSVGFTGAWGGDGGSPGNFGGYETPAAGLSFGPLVDSAGSAKWTHGNRSAGVLKIASRALDGTVVLATPGSEPTELWMSMLVSFGSAVTDAEVALSGNRLKLAIPDTGSMVLTGQGNSTRTATVTGPFATDTAHFVIMRAVAYPSTSTGESAALWVNPADFSSVTALGDPSAETDPPTYLNGGYALSSLALNNTRATDYANAWFCVDEIRIGTTLADVTPAGAPVPAGTIVLVR